MNIFLIAAFGYFIGSIPFGYIAGRLHNIDLRTVGSGSTGGTNVYRALGIRWAAASGLLDLSKGFVFMVIVGFLPNISPDVQFYLAIFPILGHIFPIWLKFKGGKGVSVAFGALIYLLGAPFALISTMIWIVALKTVKIMSLVNIVLFLLLPVYVFVTTGAIHQTVACATISFIIWWAHRENIQRLLAHTEKKLSI